MLKKIIIVSLVLAAGVSPFLPRVFADSALWKTLLADRVWNQSAFQVERLTLQKGVSEPAKRNNVAYVSQPSAQCTNLGICSKIDLTLFKNGNMQTVSGVDAQFLNPTFAMGQKGKFVYFTKSTDPTKWFDVSFVDPNTSEAHPFISLARKQNELSFVSFSTSGDRLYTSLLQTDKQTNSVRSSIVGKSKDGTYEERNISFFLNAPWQQVMDAYNDQMLVKFQFATGNKQLWLINAKTQESYAIPNTWTDPNADIFFAHFLTDGTAVFFQNYTLYTFRPGKDKAPQSVSSVKLSWNLEPNQNVQIRGDYMSWTDVNHVLAILGPEGVIELSSVKDKSVFLDKDAVYFEDQNGFWKYSFTTKKTTNTSFLVTDTLNQNFVGVDVKGSVWFENLENKILLKLGYGTNPVLTDERHVIWKGTDGALYQATLPAILSYSKSSKIFDGGLAPGDRIKATGETRVYMMGNDGALHWIVSEAVARGMYGPLWNQEIKEVSPTYLWRFSNGANIQSDQNIKSF